MRATIIIDGKKYAGVEVAEDDARDIARSWKDAIHNAQSVMFPLEGGSFLVIHQDVLRKSIIIIEP